MKFHFLALLVLAACGGPHDAPARNGGPITSLDPREEDTIDLPDTTTGITIADEFGSSSDSEAAVQQTSGPSLDLGVPSPQPEDPPAGCAERKVDFLFLVGNVNHEFFEDVYPTYLAALPAFIDIIETKFADFDKHILIADLEARWGALECESNGWCDDGVCTIPGYPCDAEPTECDSTYGAGIVFPAGVGAANHPCPLVGGRRYIVEEHPQKVAAFECVARVGTSGEVPHFGDALLGALGPTLNDPGGCNAGFLRDDAMLVLVFVAPYDDFSDLSPQAMYDVIVAARHGDLRSVATLGVINDNRLPNGLCPFIGGGLGYYYYYYVRKLIDMLPRSVYASLCEPDWVPFFDAMTDRALESCSWPTAPR